MHLLDLSQGVTADRSPGWSEEGVETSANSTQISDKPMSRLSRPAPAECGCDVGHVAERQTQSEPTWHRAREDIKVAIGDVFDAIDRQLENRIRLNDGR